MAKEEIIIDREGFDPKELTDGELLDRVYDLIAEEDIPDYQLIDVLRDLLEKARTHD